MRAEHDFPTEAAPRLFYAIATTPRSGSTYLCHRLWATGLLGAPHEYFNYRAAMLQMAARLGAQDIDQYVRRLLAVRTSPNGVFGFKAHRDHLEIAIMGELLHRFPGLRFIRLDRADRLAQAVSYALAEQTGQWFAWQARPRAPVYEAARIRLCLDRIDRATREWDDLFERERIEPLRVRYEELIQEPRTIVDGIVRHLDVPPEPIGNVTLPASERLPDHPNREWIERFRRERGMG